MTNDNWTTVKDAGGALVFIAFQIYNEWCHRTANDKQRQTDRRLQTTQGVIASNFETLRSDFAIARAAIERMGVELDPPKKRRKLSVALTAEDVAHARANGFGVRRFSRWDWPLTKPPKPPPDAA